MSGRNVVGVEATRDRGEAAPPGVLRSDPLDYIAGSAWLAAARANGSCSSRWLSALGEQTLELIDGDEDLAGRRVDSVDVGQDPPREGGAADPERLGRLGAGVAETLDAGCVTHDDKRRLCRRLSGGRRRSLGLALVLGN